MTSTLYMILAVTLLIWVTPFFLATRRRGQAATLDRRARWGILLQAVSYSLLWQNRFWDRPLDGWRIPLSMGFLIGASALSWTAARALGRQWRVDAALNESHELVTSGPYGLVRHPIYLSMLCLVLGTGFMITPWVVLIIALAAFVIGTEIRIRIEERLLAAHFGDEFDRYQHSVSAYLPFIR